MKETNPVSVLREKAYMLFYRRTSVPPPYPDARLGASTSKSDGGKHGPVERDDAPTSASVSSRVPTSQPASSLKAPLVIRIHESKLPVNNG